MNKLEAQSILDEQLSAFARRPYAELAAAVDKPVGTKVKAASGTEYQIEFNVFFESGARQDLRIVGSVDSGGWRAFVPLTKSLIMKPSGEIL